MILRTVAARHGRRVLSTPVVRTCIRCIATESASPPTPSNESHTLPDARGKFRATGIQKSVTRSIGSVVEERYAPGLLIKNPLPPKHITLERLMAAQTHMGHNASLWNPANSRYIYGIRQGIHIISLETTAAHLRRAATVVEEVSYRGGLVLFVGTRRGQMEIVTAAAKEARACHLFTKWTPGSITNRDIILRDRFLKVVDEHDNDLAGFDRHVNQARPLLPDLVVCLNPLENYTLLYECGLANIPTIGVIDTDADPSWVTYTIPANDDSLRSIAFIAGVLGQAGKQGQKRRLADASEGTVTWRTSDDITKFISGMKARRGEILSSLIDREMVGGLSQSAVSEENEALLKRVAEDDVASEEFSKEEKELIKELAANTREMDALSEEESRLLDSFTVPKGTAEEQVNEKIMSKVGVKKGVKEAVSQDKTPSKSE